MKAIATIYTETGTASKEFEIIYGGGSIFSPELVTWVINRTDRVSNYINITANGRTHVYSL